jgi:hypothetical protein
MMSPRPPKVRHDVSVIWHAGPRNPFRWASCPMEAQARLVLPKLGIEQGPAKQKGTPSKDLKSKISRQV